MTEGPAPGSRRPAERLKAFTDAVVAIAMTLLILPLLESVSEAARAGTDTAGYLGEHAGQLLGFLLSFVIIAAFWHAHHRLFEHVERYGSALLLLTVAWMLTIVVLPVATAMVGQMETDRLQVALYVGTMLATCVLLSLSAVVVCRDPTLWDGRAAPGGQTLAGSLAPTALMAAAFVLGVLVSGYLPLLVLLLTAPLQRWLAPRVTRWSGPGPGTARGRRARG